MFQDLSQLLMHYETIKKSCIYNLKNKNIKSILRSFISEEKEVEKIIKNQRKLKMFKSGKINF